ncbi:MAG: DNA-deoxyinosine glycosylase, partial [Eggerthellaceae bacterium]|nr:DNA-deoxyinosine glycosylase [Eggerthellaceae bacterium]
MAELERIVHSIPPTYDERSRVLMLGSLPSPKSRETGYNYGHPQNRFWKVLATLANEPVPTTNERKRDFCLRHHIALWDVVGECQIEGASDASIRDAKPNPLWEITQAAPIEAVFCTGAKSHELYGKLCEERVGIPAVKLPSTSPANAACSMDQLLESYAQVFEHTHEFEPPCLDVPDVVALEQAIAAAGTPLSELMDRAGTALALRVEAILRGLEAGTYPRPIAATETEPLVVLLCGSGNNGGDGWVAATLLAQHGHRVCLVTKKAAEDITAQPAHDAAIRAADSLCALGGAT